MPKARPDLAEPGRPAPRKRSRVLRVPPRRAIDFPVVGIGASAGGLNSCRNFLEGLPAGIGMAFILVQHLDPTHESMMVDLLASHTSMTVRQAVDGMPIERDHLYVIPPGSYLAVDGGALRLSKPLARHGARLPFDFLLHSLSTDSGARAVCIVLSGTGADGTVGLRSIKERSGLVIVQDPEEAGFDGMPRNAIATGSVDFVLPVAEIPRALLEFARRPAIDASDDPARASGAQRFLPAIIDLLRTRSAHDFRLYKEGTLLRRIERRMGLASINTDDTQRYLDILGRDGKELDLLAKDLLINVTSFFRDPKVFETLAKRVVPDLVRGQPPDQPLRIWVVGCSTGEETYSLAMLFSEQIAAAKRNVKLQIFASDVDPDAVAEAREGLYPEAVEADVSPERLARFFTKEDHGYRISSDLRSSVVFAVQDVLADPPFSRLDLISCRNLLIYLRPEAQAKAIALFHFALRDRGLLLLGSSETVGSAEGRFEVVSKQARLYRRIGHSRPGEIAFAMRAAGGDSVPLRPGRREPASHQVTLAELCRQLVMEAYAPAAVLIDSNYECLYSVGPTDRYLRVAAGSPTHDLLAMVREGIRTKLRSAIQQATQEGDRVVVSGGRVRHDGQETSFNIEVHPVRNESAPLLLICFVDSPERADRRKQSATQGDPVRVAELERELEVTKTELQGAIRNLEISIEDQNAINEEALSVNEEFQSTNEELLTSKEELQSLNEELSALNSQLQETLERQRLASNDLQNVMYSTDVATLFLDSDMNIRFFTPATKALFNVIPGDIGRPIADLNSLAPDGALVADANRVIETLVPVDREIEVPGGTWYLRRIMPYRTEDNGVQGVVITFADITERRRAADALEAAKQEAERANVAKSRFLAAASHDLRQPLQTLALLNGRLATQVKDEKTQKLITMFDQTLSAMSDMLNTLLDLNQIEAGIIHPTIVRCPINDLLARLADAFAYSALAQGISLRVVPCSLSVRTDPHLLEQMIRNLLSNAIKYSRSGKVLLGCRRHAGRLSIEVYDTGHGIPEDQLKAIFEEYRQLDNPNHERNRGLGLGLSIVQRLGLLLDHRISVRSRLGRGSVFAVEVDIAPGDPGTPTGSRRGSQADRTGGTVGKTGEILVVEDDPAVRSLLQGLLVDRGFRTTVAADGIAALDMVARGTSRPDLLLADFDLPNRMDGLQLATALRRALDRQVPTIILTGAISTDLMRSINSLNCVRLTKPVKVNDLLEVILALLSSATHRGGATGVPRAAAADDKPAGPAVIYIVDDDRVVRSELRAVLEEDGRSVEDYATCEAFLEAYRSGTEACLLIDAYLPGMSGIELLHKLRDAGHRLPAIMITGSSDVPMAVRAMKAGAIDFIEKPVGRDDLLAVIAHALELSRDTETLSARREEAAARLARLTPRQRIVMEMVLAGAPNKNIAADLGISQRTVENHRAAIMQKTGSKSLPALVRLAVAAGWNDGGALSTEGGHSASSAAPSAAPSGDGRAAPV
ncbi:chemotaxis protein CheB [Thalassobaculum sp.]|uniref:chemotaxis protein CheB n=1 Tax=Thalassobaculum sp. TaxID=2022740 RepID=UPI0032EEBCE9